MTFQDLAQENIVPNKKGIYRKKIFCWWARANFHVFWGWIAKESIEVGQPTPQ